MTAEHPDPAGRPRPPDAPSYPDTLTVGEARDVYFHDNGFTLAGYTDRWVKLKLGPIPIAFPNTQARRKAVKLHDLHHVATNYATTWTGEAEIGAWEVGAGCGRYWAAWLLNLSALGIGMWIAPRRVLRAFARGRRSRSLYQRTLADVDQALAELLPVRVGELREQLALAPAPRSTWGDRIALGGWLGVSALLMVLSLTPILVLVWLAF